MAEEEEIVAVVLNKGTVDALQNLSSLVTGATMMGAKVVVFLQTWGAWAFLKENIQKLDQFDENSFWSPEYKQYAASVIKEMKRAGTASWYELFKEAKEEGLLEILVCSTAAEQWGVNTTSAFDDLVDDITGVFEWHEIASKALYTYYIG
ncbi:MAG: DsrE family protein [Archaeoglobus sp.]|nr:DsrE family protein [Archaeoglobus sp.]